MLLHSLVSNWVNNLPTSLLRWDESPGFRFWVWLFLPGHLIFYIWIGLGIWMSFEAFSPDIEKKLQLFLLGSFMVVVGIYFQLGAYQVMLHDVRRLFIVYSLIEGHERIYVKGFYFKNDSFLLNDIEDVKRFRTEGHWLKRINTIFAREIDHCRLDLKDGRQYCFQGKSKGVEDMLTRLSGKKILEQLPENWDIVN